MEKSKIVYIDRSYFTFKATRYGQWKVSYKTPSRARMWTKTISDTLLIDAVRNNEHPKVKDLIRLKNLVKYNIK